MDASLQSPFPSLSNTLFISLIAHQGDNIVIQGIISLIGAISHPAPSCQMAVFPWSLPVFTVTCHGRALSATEGFSTEEWMGFQPLLGVLGLLFSPPHLLSLLFLRWVALCSWPCS